MVLSLLALAAADARRPHAPVQGLVCQDGLLKTCPDPDTGRIWVRLPEGDPPLLLVAGHRTGLGSNPVGLDRGALSEPRLVQLRRTGGKVLLVQQNLAFRAGSGDEAERRAVAESFATSVVWSTEDRDGWIDLGGLLLQDLAGVVQALDDAGQGDFSLDRERSAVEAAATLVFPDNLVFESALTWTGADPGGEVRSVAPDPRAVTLVQTVSLIRLPDGRFEPSTFDPRGGAFSLDYQDYASPLDAPLRRQLALRHRLAEPLIYYVDPGAPEPIRTALVEGASWWTEAFDAAGLPGTFRVAILPAYAHPLDVRYNVIQWVHRATRGWSYGNAVADPRTGEILKGHVSLGSLRIRHDRLLFEGLAGTAATGTGRPDDPIVLALGRLRQLAAHEVGHTLGLAHNFAASTQGRASVMDYPAPWVHVVDGALDFGRAYDVGVGAWDIAAIRWLYGDGALPDPALRFLTDADARPAGAAHPAAALWDNGDDAVRELERSVAVRAAALATFGTANLRTGQPVSHLREVFAPVYFHHRYQVDAVAKAVGGLGYRYAVVGEEDVAATAVPAPSQRRALDALLQLLDPSFLAVPAPVVGLLLPPAPGTSERAEVPEGYTAPAFDGDTLAETAARMVIDALTAPARLARLEAQHRVDRALPGADEVLGALEATVFAPRPADPGPRGLQEATQRAVVDRWIALSSRPSVAPTVRARVDHRLKALADAGEDGAHAAALREQIRRHRERIVDVVPHRAPDPPPGSPIGHLAGCGG